MNESWEMPDSTPPVGMSMNQGPYASMSHVTCTNESCHMYECVIGHARLHAARWYVNESCGVCIDGACHVYEQVMAQV